MGTNNDFWVLAMPRVPSQGVISVTHRNTLNNLVINQFGLSNCPKKVWKTGKSQFEVPIQCIIEWFGNGNPKPSFWLKKLIRSSFFSIKMILWLPQKFIFDLLTEIHFSKHIIFPNTLPLSQKPLKILKFCFESSPREEARILHIHVQTKDFFKKIFLF